MLSHNGISRIIADPLLIVPQFINDKLVTTVKNIHHRNAALWTSKTHLASDKRSKTRLKISIPSEQRARITNQLLEHYFLVLSTSQKLTCGWLIKIQ